MLNQLSILKGIHPGKIVGREIEKRQFSKGRFALSLEEYPQTFGAIINGHRKMNTKLSLKIEKEFGWEEGLLMSLQVFYDIKKEKEVTEKKACPNIRKILFWDTDFDSIDWDLQKKAVIKRVFERGNTKEKEELIQFYGEQEVKKYIE